jgi:lysophospholipase L1-like esterase
MVEQLDYLDEAEYCIVAIGTNDIIAADTATWQARIDVIESIARLRGMIPVIAVPPLMSGSTLVQTVLAPYILAKGWKTMRFDIATSVNGDGVTQNTSLFQVDGVHPNDAGHAAMLARAKIDLPEIFD